MAFPLPDNSHRISVIGSTGSGKTQAAVWHLSMRDFHLNPWIIIDFKLDELIGDLGAKEIKITDNPPRKAGLFVVRPKPHQTEELERFLWKIWENGNTGIFIDEGYMIPNDSAAFQAILTQGRSKKVPVITLSQRPVQINRFVFSEADFYQVFRLNDKRDRDTVQAFIPKRKIDLSLPIQPFHSWYYAGGQDKHFLLRPVPSRDSLIRNFRAKLGFKPLYRVVI